MGSGKLPRAKRGRGFFAPRYVPFARTLLGFLAEPYLRFVEGVSGFQARGVEHLARAFSAFQEGEERLIIMFRHVAKEDAPVMVRLIARELPRWCRRNGLSLDHTPHVHFLYGKDVLNWAGAGARWLFPRIGGIPVVNTRLDRESQDTIRETLVGGPFPLAFAPEGQVTYHMFKTSPLAPGAATLADWTCLGLQKLGKPGKVTILPCALGYRPAGSTEGVIRMLEKQLARKLSLPEQPGIQNGSDEEGFHLLMAEKLIELMEELYAAQYPGIYRDVQEQLKPSDLQERFQGMCETVIRCGEAALGWIPSGSTLERIFRLRYWIMESFHREDLDPETLSPLKKNRADHRALHALVLKRHSELADILEYIDFSYLHGKNPLRRVEFLLNLLDVVNRLEGGNINSRFTLKGKEARVIVGEPFRGESFFDEHPDSRKRGREALMQQLYGSFTALEEELEGWLWNPQEPEAIG